MKVTVVIPVFNDTRSLAELLKRLRTVASTRDYWLNVVLVDDGSHQQTWQQLLRIKQQQVFPVTLIRLMHNQGQHFATLCGLLHSSGEVVITMDADLQHPPEEIPTLIATLQAQQAELVYGTSMASHSLGQRISSWLFKLLLQQLNREVSRHANAFRALDQRLILKLEAGFHQPFYSIDTPLLALSARSCVITTQHYPRTFGHSSYNLAKKIKLALSTLYYSKGFFRFAALLASLLGVIGIAMLPLTAMQADNIHNLDLLLILSSASSLFALKHLYKSALHKNTQPQRHIAEIVP